MTRRIWMTKWVTGWLPLGKNMKHWGFWTTDLCPECQQPESNPSHLFQCFAPERRQWLKNKICTLERTLLERKLSLQAVSLLLGVLFPQEFPRPTSSPEELIEIRHWQGVFNTLPTAWGFLHHSWTLVIQRCPPVATNFKHSPRRWLAVFLSQLWNIAWDLWGYRNGIIHSQDNTRTGDIIRQQVTTQYTLGLHSLPPNEGHWFAGSLETILARPLEYLHAWLLTIQALRNCCLE